MAVASSPAAASKSNNKEEDQPAEDTQKLPESGSPNPKPKKPAAKRTKSPGVRVVSGRIYDPQNGKTCHQCRQKTLDFCADCKNHIKDKQCTLKFCHACLLNRYGEKAEEVALLGDWNCPRCRGICNCSLCMKKRGHQPTGMLVRAAKASGFSSVSDLLHVKGSEITKKLGASPRKLAAVDEETKIASPRKLGKENLYEGKIDVNLGLPSASSPAKEKTNKRKKGSKEMHDVNGDNALSKESGSSPTEKKRKNMEPEVSQGTQLNEATRKSPRITKSPRVMVGNLKEAKAKEEADGVRQEEMVTKKKIHQEVDDAENKIQTSVEALDSGEHQNEIQNEVVMASFMDAHDKFLDDDIPLPTGTELTTVAGIDLPAQDVGHALQFLEFCAAFGKILDVKKGHAEAILRELTNGRNTRRGKSTLTVQFQIQLLSFIQKDSGSPPLSETDGKDSWLSVLKECVNESYCSLDSLPLDSLDGDVDGYDSLDSSMKLRILNFLCDEVLETAELRTWIEDQYIKFAEETKEAKAEVIAAKQKEKLLRKKKQDDIAKAVVAKNGAPLSISEHEAIVSQIKSEAAQARAEILDSKSMVTKDNQISEAVRTVAVHLDSNGFAYWRLNGYSDKSEILGQDIGTTDEVKAGEKWFTYDDERTDLIEKKIKSLSRREKRIRRKIQFKGVALPLENKDAILS